MNKLYRIFVGVGRRGFFNWMSDRLYLRIAYFLKFDKCINFDNPQTFNEKLQWLKLNDRKDIYATMVDKFEVKKYVSNIIGNKYIIPSLGVYDKWDDINFDALPNQFVIKCTHDSGSVVVVKNKLKFDYKKAKRKILRGLKNNGFNYGREWVYKKVKPRIIIEKYVEDVGIGELRDYKFFCFNGKVKFFKIDFNRFIKHQANYYDIDGNLLYFGELSCPPDYDKKLNIPNNLDKMIELAEKLSNNITFVRIDFYEANNSLYFGEITFYPASGMGKFTPDEWDRKIGNYLRLPSINHNSSRGI